MKDTIEIPVRWLESLARLTENAQESVDNGYHDSNIHILLGFASSARTLIKLHKNKEAKDG